MKLVSVAEMRKMEEHANAAGYTYAEVMHTAGEGIALHIARNHSKDGVNFALGLVGGGNNGGDTLVALTILQSKGWTTRVILLKERNKEDPLLEGYLESGGEVSDVARLSDIHATAGIILDGIYGTGFRPPLPEITKTLLAEVKKTLPGFVWVAVDCPSGVDCESGEVSSGTVKVQQTVCLEAVKKGMLTYSAYPYSGEIVTVDLGISKYLNAGDQAGDLVVTQDFVRALLPARDAFSHKGSFGVTLVIGGCVNYPGAPVLAGRAAYAVGTGLVKVAVPASIYPNGLASSLELTWVVLEDAGGIISEIAAETALPYALGSHSLVIGPGLGREDSTKRFLHNLLLGGRKSRDAGAGFPGIERQPNNNGPNPDLPPVVIDADGLFLLADDADWPEKLNTKAVLTPHPGEMARLTGSTIEEIQSDRLEIARKSARNWGQTLVLKGPLTVIADATGRVAVIPVATSSLAKAGTGDVLAGMIGGLLAQGMNSWEAAVTGAWLHAQAGLTASVIVGCDASVMASDVISTIPFVYRSI